VDLAAAGRHRPGADRASLVAPLAARVRGLYLAILTLGLVFVGEHMFKEARTFTGGAGIGRSPAEPVIARDEPLLRPDDGSGSSSAVASIFYLFCLLLLIGLASSHATSPGRGWGGRSPRCATVTSPPR
jgi:branched-chain amino acid transport system permease protein